MDSAIQTYYGITTIMRPCSATPSAMGDVMVTPITLSRRNIVMSSVHHMNVTQLSKNLVSSVVSG